MTNTVEKQEGWMMRLVIAICEKIAGWLMSHDLSVSPHESLLCLPYHSMGWEEAVMAQAAVRFKQIEDEGA